MNFSIFVVLFSVYLKNINSLKVIVEKGRDFCINKNVAKDEILKGSYVVSGEKEDSVHVTLIGPNSLLYFENKYENYLKPYGEFEIGVEVFGKFILCFSCKHHLSSIISFQFSTLNESSHLISVANHEVIEDVYKNVTNVSYLFEEIEKYLKFYAERKGTHEKIIYDAINTINKANIYKILIIVLFSFLQIFLVKKLFKRRDYSKKYNYNDVNKSKDDICELKL